MFFIISIIALILIFVATSSDYFIYRWVAFFSITSLIIYDHLSIKTSNRLAFLVIFLLSYGAYLCLFRNNHIYIEMGRQNGSLLFLEAKTLIFVMCFAFLVSIKRMASLAMGINFMSVILIIVSFLFDIFWEGSKGFAYNSSVTSTTFGLMLSFAFLIESSKLRRLLACAITLMIAHYHGMSGLLSALIFWSIELYRIKRFMGVIPILLLLTVCVAYPSVASDSHRIAHYKLAMELWFDKFNPIMGSGLGTFQFFMPVYQMQSNNNEIGYFIWLHSDILQAVFELGIVGILLISLVAYEIVKIGITNRSLFILSFCSCYIQSAMFNFPTHMASDVLLLIIAMRYTYNLRDVDREKVFQF